MKHLLLVVLMCSVLALAPSAFAQKNDADAAANQVVINAINDRMRGKSVSIQDQQGLATPTGKNVNVRDIAVKTKEMNELVHSVNLDVINLDKGVLSADLNQKLKKIEKLAKEIRRTLE